MAYSRVSPASLAVLFLLFALPLTAADCGFVSVDATTSAAVAKGVTAYYPITVTNEGLADALVAISGYCPSDVDCSFSPSPSYATLHASESAMFNLAAGTTYAEIGAHYLSLNVSAGADPSPCYNKQLTLEVLNAQPKQLTQQSFTVTMIPGGLSSSGWAGDTMEYEISVANNEDNMGYAEFLAEGAFASTTTFSSSRITILPHSTKVVKARVLIPPGTPGSVYDMAFLVKATAGGACCEQTYNLPVKVCVFADNLILDVLNEPVSCVAATHNQDSTVDFELRNRGEISGPFHAYLVGSTKALKMLTLSSDLVEVAPGDRVPLTLHIAPSPSDILDTYYFNLKIDYLGFTVYDKPYCFTVSGVEDFVVDYNATAVIRRCKVETIPFTITNNGTLSDDYEIEAQPINNMLIQPVPAAFSLSPGASKHVDMVMSTTLSTSPALGDYSLKFVVRSKRVAKAVTIPFRLVASEEQGESFLGISAGRFDLLAGGRSTASITVSNMGVKSIRAVAVSIEGLPDDYYSIDTTPRNLAPGDSQQFQLSFSLPADFAQKQFAVRAASALDSEAVKINVTPSVTQARFQSLGFTVSGVNYYGSEVLVSIIVSNDGSSPLNGVQPSATGFIVAAQPSELNLAPGESKSMTLSLQGAQAGSMVPVTLKSSEGVESNTIQLGIEAQQAQSFPWMLVAIAGLVLVILAYAFIVKREDGGEGSGLVPPRSIEEEPDFKEVEEEAKLYDFEDDEKK